MSAVVSPVPEDVFTALGNFIQLVLGNTIPVIRGVVNRVATPPAAPGFVAMTALFQDRLSTNVDSYTDTYGDLIPAETMSAESSTRIDIQVDFYGAASAVWAKAISTLFRDEYGCSALAPNCQPLYADDARMIPLIDGEQQYEERWLLTATLQYNPIVTVPQQFAGAAALDVINVEERYKPVPPAQRWTADSDSITADSGTVTADDS